MQFYTTIAPYYNEIFPLQPLQVAFLKSLLKKKEGNVLDLGCGTGALASEMAREVTCVAALDFDKEMIKIALKKYQSQRNLHFINLDMREAGDYFLSAKFVLAYCFGNTLVHLNSIDDIADTIKSLKNILEPGSDLIIQILNYDFILDNKISTLPLIENERIKFERYYHFEENGRLIFHTILFAKREKNIIENKIELLPLKKGDLMDILTGEGYSNLGFYSGFDKSPYSATTLPLIVTAELS
jgi:SAM-dependent methyltransferase